MERNSKEKRFITHIGKDKRDRDESGVYFTGVKSECKYRLKEAHRRFF